MKNIRMIAAGLVLIAAATARAQDPGELEKLLLNRTGENRKAVGIVVGLADATGERFLASGATAPGGAVLPGADTVYEIGSITKVFASLVLADVVVRGEVGLDDPVAKFLPATVKVPERDGKRITLRDLSTQVSGLPRMPDNLNPPTGPIRTSITVRTGSTSSWPRSNSRGASARSTGIPTWASDYSAMPWL